MNNIYRNKTLAKECLLAFDKIILRYEMSKKKNESDVISILQSILCMVSLLIYEIGMGRICFSRLIPDNPFDYEKKQINYFLFID